MSRIPAQKPGHGRQGIFDPDRQDGMQTPWQDEDTITKLADQGRGYEPNSEATFVADSIRSLGSADPQCFGAGRADIGVD